MDSHTNQPSGSKYDNKKTCIPLFCYCVGSAFSQKSALRFVFDPISFSIIHFNQRIYFLYKLIHGFEGGAGEIERERERDRGGGENLVGHIQKIKMIIFCVDRFIFSRRVK